MSSIEVRPFRRADRDQVTALVNAHAAAVVPGVSVSINTVMAQLEREPGEFVVDPWVVERATVVAELRGRVVAAAHMLRYGAGEDVGESFRDAGEIRWLLFWPGAGDAARDLVSACLAIFDEWRVQRQYADGALPTPGVYGVPEQWPHVRALYEETGIVHEGPTEIVYIAAVEDMPHVGAAPVEGMAASRSVGVNGTRLSATVGDELGGFIEVATLEDAGRIPRHGGLAEIGNLHVDEAYRRRGVATWLVAQAAEWLRLGRVERVLDYAWPDEDACMAFLESVGFRELTRTQRGWVRS